MEDRVIEWLLDLFGLTPDCGGALVTGATMANFTCLAAADTPSWKRPAGTWKAGAWAARRR